MFSSPFKLLLLSIVGQTSLLTASVCAQHAVLQHAVLQPPVASQPQVPGDDKEVTQRGSPAEEVAQELKAQAPVQSIALPHVSLGLPTFGPTQSFQNERSGISGIEIIYGNAPLRSSGQLANVQITLGELALPPLPGETSGPEDLGPEALNQSALGREPDSLLGLEQPTSPAYEVQRSQVRSLPPPGGELQTEKPEAASKRPFSAADALPPQLLGGAAGNENVVQEQVGDNQEAASESIPAPAPEPSIENRLDQPKEADSVTGPDQELISASKGKKSDLPIYYQAYGGSNPPRIDATARQIPFQPDAFLPSPIMPYAIDPFLEASPYRGKSAVPTQRPWVELWRPLYTGGIYPPAKDWFGRYNLLMPHFMVYGDFRTGPSFGQNAGGDSNTWGNRLNLDLDLELTATERIHAFTGPLDRGGDFTHFDFDRNQFVDRTDIRFDTLFFEGDAGAIWGGLSDQDAPFDLPFTFGFLPLFYQNGVWANDNVIGAAFALPSRHNRWLKWSNYDATFFWASDQITTDAFAGDNNAAEFVGTAWFIEAYDGYIEADYAFVHDDVGQNRSYHNLSFAYTRRYFHRLSNSIRIITNLGQDLPSEQRTADGHLLLIENSLISAAPNTFVPYCNFFYGQGRTQSLARAGVAGGILTNTGISFEIDGLTGYPTLDATGVNTTGAAVGLNMLGADFSHQLVVEFAALAANGSAQFRNAPGDEYGVSVRYQKPLNNAWIFRTDHIVGWRRNADDINGSRFEFRWKF